MKTRKAIFSGKFYPKSPIELRSMISSFIDQEKDKIKHEIKINKAIGAIVPHAGYIYSGHHAIHPFEIISKSKTNIETVIVINPNHTGFGIGEANICDYQQWETPLGNLSIDIDFQNQLNIKNDNSAHAREHSGEVLLPLIRYYFQEGIKIIMLTINQQTPEVAQKLAKTIHLAAKTYKRDILLLASSDFCHFETPVVGYAKDQYLINEILALSSNNIYEQVKKHEISACGYGAIMVLLEYAKLEAQNPQIKLLSRGHSGESYPSEKVVDYASFVCFC